MRDFAANETKTQYEPLRSFDWAMRARARLHGYAIPLLCGDLELGLTKHASVTDDYGRWVGTGTIREVYA